MYGTQPIRMHRTAVFFSLQSWELALVILAVIGTSTAVGYMAGRYLRQHQAKLREPFGVLQAALLGVVGLILAFGLSLAVGRYEDRRLRLWTRRMPSERATSGPS